MRQFLSARIKQRLKGLRTLLASLVVTLLGLAAFLDPEQVKGILGLFIKDEHQLGSIMVGVGVLFAVLRVITSTGVFSKDEE